MTRAIPPKKPGKKDIRSQCRRSFRKTRRPNQANVSNAVDPDLLRRMRDEIIELLVELVRDSGLTSRKPT